jgi:hypothetical protein
MPDHRKPGLLGRLRRLISERASRAELRQAAVVEYEMAQWRAWLGQDRSDQQPEPDSWQAKYWQ